MYCMTCTNRVDKCRCTEDALSEAQAEITRLKVEVSLWKHREKAAMKIAHMNGGMVDKARAERINAHNNALEIAAQITDSCAEGSIREDMFQLARAIRSRKHPIGENLDEKG